MSSRRDQIVDSIVTDLSSTGKPSGLNVHRHRTTPIGLDNLPAQVVYIVDEEVKTGPGMGVGSVPARKAIRTCKVRVETRIDAGSDTPDQALDPYLTWSVQKVCGNPRRAGLAHDTVEASTQWAAQEDDKVYAAAQQDFIITYATSSADPGTA